jgi:hypothetical protein
MTDEIAKVVRVNLAGETASPEKAFSIEIVPLGGEQRVSSDYYNFEDLSSSLETLTRSLYETIKKIQPTKASIEFGVEIGVQSGKLTALLVKGSGKANLKVKLEWD